MQENDFLLKAKDAEEQATKAKDPTIKATWLQIADNYRYLAAHSQKKP